MFYEFEVLILVNFSFFFFSLFMFDCMLPSYELLVLKRLKVGGTIGCGQNFYGEINPGRRT